MDLFLNNFGRLRRRTGGREDKYFLGGGVGGDATWLGILSTLLQNDGKAELRVAVRRSTTGVLDFCDVCVCIFFFRGGGGVGVC